MWRPALWKYGRSGNPLLAHSTTEALYRADSTACRISDAAPGGDVLAAAIRYRNLGWSIIPIADGKKTPACKSWKSYQHAPATEPKLRSWFTGKSLGMAVVLGDASGGLLCRDFDELGAYEQWAADHSGLANTLPTVETSRGRHVYFRTAEGSRVKRTADGEIRGSGGYSVLPPSRHPSGAVYRWLIEPADEVPEVDPLKSGLFGSRYTESAENAETAESADVVLGGVCVCVDAGLQTAVASRRATTLAELADWPSGTIEALKDSLPTAVGRRNAMVFELCRALKAIPALAECGARDLRRCVEVWHAMALPVIGTKPFEDTWADFLRGWPAVKFPKGADPMTSIVSRAIENPLPPAAAAYDSPKCRFLVAICRELQRSAGDAPFYLSCHKAAKLVGVTPRTAWKWFFVLENDEVLSVVERGESGKVGGKATRYRYISPD